MEVVGEEVRNIGPDFQGVTYTLLLLWCGVHSASRGCIQSKTWCMSRLKLILSQSWSTPLSAIRPHYKEKGWSGEISPIG